MGAVETHGVLDGGVLPSSGHGKRESSGCVHRTEDLDVLLVCHFTCALSRRYFTHSRVWKQ
jgi:hypothetical protein